MSAIAVLSAAGGAAWEARLLGDLGPDGNPHGARIVRRCVDVVDLLAVAASGQGEAALVSATLRRLDADALERLAASAVAVVVVLDGDAETPAQSGSAGSGQRDGFGVDDGGGDTRGTGSHSGSHSVSDSGPDSGPGDAGRLRALGVRHFVAASAPAEVVAAALHAAYAEMGAGAGGVARRGFGLSTAAADPRMHDPLTDPPLRPVHGELGALVAVWGPAGGPGRSTVAATLADEIARLGLGALLIDGDVYGGSIATMLGLLDESPGIAAAARQAGNGRLDAPALAALCWAAEPGLRVLTGLPRADRWPELRPPALERMLAVSRSMADFTVVDVGFCLESDEELSFDTAAPRRNGATLAMLDAADVVIAVGAADPIGLTRLLRGLEDLKAAGVSAPIWIVLNRVRPTATRGPARAELAAAVARFAGQPPAAYLPYDQSGVDAAVIAGRPIARVAPGSAYRSAVIELAIALTGAPRPDRTRRGARRASAHRRSTAGR